MFRWLIQLLVKNVNAIYVVELIHWNATTRHVFFGTANRKKAEQDGCWIWLCHYHHTGSNNSVHFNIKVDREVKRQAQRVWLDHYNKTVEDFIKRYGRNYDIN